MIWLFRKFLSLRRVVCSKHSARQLALGLACGLILGLVPKGNLMAVLVTSMLLATRMSVVMGMVSATFVSLVAPLCDPLTHRLGEYALTHSALAPLWSSLSRLPFAAWTSFNNTVVMGSLLLGVALFYPTYRLSLPLMKRLRQSDEAGPSIGATQAAPGRSVARRAPTASPPVHVAASQRNIIPRRTTGGQRRSCA